MTSKLAFPKARVSGIFDRRDKLKNMQRGCSGWNDHAQKEVGTHPPIVIRRQNFMAVRGGTYISKPKGGDDQKLKKKQYWLDSRRTTAFAQPPREEQSLA